MSAVREEWTSVYEVVEIYFVIARTINVDAVFVRLCNIACERVVA